MINMSVVRLDTEVVLDDASDIKEDDLVPLEKYGLAICDSTDRYADEERKLHVNFWYEDRERKT